MADDSTPREQHHLVRTLQLILAMAVAYLMITQGILPGIAAAVVGGISIASVKRWYPTGNIEERVLDDA